MAKSSTRKIYVGGVPVGGGSPIMVQSMTNTDTRNIEATAAQIGRLAAKGCEVVRVAVPDMAACSSFKQITGLSPVPLVADIHFDWRLAVASMESGAVGVRINPGNIGSESNIKRVIDAAKSNNCVIRIGVNSGSIKKNILAKYGHPTPEAMVESALENIDFFEKQGFYNLKISIKSSSVLDTIKAYRLIHAKCNYPLHLGVTEAGGGIRGTVKSSIGLGILLAEGIGDTIRVSLTDYPEREVEVAWEILRSLNLRHHGPEIISCPTCGRTEIDLFSMVSAIEKMVVDCKKPIKIAVMGCVVNGPGEAREADIGVAGGKDMGIIFKKGKVIGSAKGDKAILEYFEKELQALLEENSKTK